jgi:hypothetical protein
MNNVETIPLIAINVMKTRLDDVDNAKLIDEIKNSRGDIDKNYLEDKHHTYYEDKRYPFGMPESEKLISKLVSSVSSVLGREMELSEIWTLTLDEGQSVAAHSHKSNTYVHQEEYFSIAYYPNAPENSADLIFLATACNTLETSITIPPKTGDLVIFNSYLMHMTNRHRNKNEQRIVISANFAPKKPNIQPSQDWSAYSRTAPQASENHKNTYHLTAQTIFGEEEYILFETDNGEWKIRFNGNTVDIDNVNITENKITANFVTQIPMTAEVIIYLDLSPDRGIDGFVQIGQFMRVRVLGSKG